jgi:hypothetical protein
MGIFQDSDVVAAHYRVSADAAGRPLLVAMAPLQSGLDTVGKFVEIDEAGNKVCFATDCLHRRHILFHYIGRAFPTSR